MKWPVFASIRQVAATLDRSPSTVSRPIPKPRFPGSGMRPFDNGGRDDGSSGCPAQLVHVPASFTLRRPVFSSVPDLLADRCCSGPTGRRLTLPRMLIGRPPDKAAAPIGDQPCGGRRSPSPPLELFHVDVAVLTSPFSSRSTEPAGALVGPGLRRDDVLVVAALRLRRGLQRVAPVPDLPAQILAIRDDLAALDLPHLDVAGDDVAVLVQVDRTGGALVVDVCPRRLAPRPA